MAKESAKNRAGRGGPGQGPAGKHLVIVESPAKAKTINKYLGPGYVVKASVGHVRDLPKRNPKGVKSPVPGVDLEQNFSPTYEVITGKGKTIAELRKAAKGAADIWLATDLDREGEAIAWHLSEALGVDEGRANRVVFNAITRDEIRRAFEHPRRINMDKVNAQQARRILDRIVGYQVSPLLWKKVAGGLSAGRVQSVAVRLIVEREREIRGFVPDEEWRITGYFTLTHEQALKLGPAWVKFLSQRDEKGNGPTVKSQNGWLGEAGAIRAELIEYAGKRFEPAVRVEKIIGPLTPLTDEAIRGRLEKAAGEFNDPGAYDVSPRVEQVAAGCGLRKTQVDVQEDSAGRGPARWRRTIRGELDASGPWEVESIATKRTRSRPYPPFITSTLQQAAANVLGYQTHRTMRLAQQLYEGVEIGGMGSVGLITYMRTDSTYLAPEAAAAARGYIKSKFGEKHLPEGPVFYKSSNTDAQEAHEAIRPTDVQLHPDDPAVRGSLDEQQYKLYRLIWQRFVACQMTPAEWDSTTLRISSTVNGAKAVFRSTGRTLVFDGFYRVVGVPNVSDELTLPPVKQGQRLWAFLVEPVQRFTSPPPRYTEASLVKKLESEGIGRPSTYASIIKVIQDRRYVEKRGTAFNATDLGMVVTDKLIEGFPKIMDIGYTRQMESQLDAIEEQHRDWVKFLREFYGPFRKELEHAHEEMSHAKSEMEPAPYPCPECGAATVYRFGRSGRFLSCSRYPDCKYAAPIDREGKPQTPEVTDVACPVCGKPMQLRRGRFGPFLSCSGYPECKGIVKLDKKGHVSPPKVPPLVTDLPCPKCGSPLNIRSSKRGPWLSCSKFPKCRGREAWSKIDQKLQKKWELNLLNHEKANPQPVVRTMDGKPISEGYTPRVAGGNGEGGADDSGLDADAA